MRSRSFVVLALAAVVAFVCNTDGQGIGDRNRPSEGGSHNITGRVYLPNGRPAGGVKVLINGDFTNTSTNTNMDGVFTFGSIPGGNYNVTVRAEGYQNETESLTIERFASAGQGYQMTIHLRNPGQAKGSTAVLSPLLVGVPKDAVSKFEKGREKLSKDDAKGALSDFDAAIAAYPNFAAAYYERGSAYLKLKDPDKATESFVKAITIKQDYVEAKYGYGLAQFQKNDYVVAAAAFNDVLQAKKDMAEAHLNLGISLFYLKNVEAAETELKSAVSAKGGESFALAHLYLGQIYAQKKKNSEAASELQKYLDLAPKAPNADRIRSAIADLKKQS